MKVRIVLEPRVSATYDQLLAMARAAESAGASGAGRGARGLRGCAAAR